MNSLVYYKNSANRHDKNLIVPKFFQVVRMDIIFLLRIIRHLLHKGVYHDKKTRKNKGYSHFYTQKPICLIQCILRNFYTLFLDFSTSYEVFFMCVFVCVVEYKLT